MLRLVADIFNLTNRGNLYSNPDVSGFVGLSNCAPNGPVGGQPTIGFTCDPLTAIPKQGSVFTVPTLPGGPFNGVPQVFNYGVHDEISPGSTPFAAQLGIRLSF